MSTPDDFEEMHDSLERFKAIADTDCITATIERAGSSWWVQFIDYTGEKTVPAVHQEMPEAIEQAIKNFEELERGAEAKGNV